MLSVLLEKMECHKRVASFLEYLLNNFCIFYHIIFKSYNGVKDFKKRSYWVIQLRFCDYQFCIFNSQTVFVLIVGIKYIDVITLKQPEWSKN